MNSQNLALILIDIQRDFWGPLKKYSEFEAFPENISNLLFNARELKVPIIHIKSSFNPDRSNWMMFYRPHGRGNVPCIEGSVGAVIEDFAEPLQNEIIVIKQTFDGFINTNLMEVLEAHDIKGALFAGLETSVCILFTATSAYLRDIVPIVVSDACADEPMRHEATLRMYRDLCFKTVTTNRVRYEWQSVEHLVEQFVK